MKRTINSIELEISPGADLQGANLQGANLQGATIRDGLKIKSLKVYDGLYRYTVYAFVTVDNIPWVRMGCLWHSVKEWDKIGIRESNTSEFPNDGSLKSGERVSAFEFARSRALALKESL